MQATRSAYAHHSLLVPILIIHRPNNETSVKHEWPTMLMNGTDIARSVTVDSKTWNVKPWTRTSGRKAVDKIGLRWQTTVHRHVYEVKCENVTRANYANETGVNLVAPCSSLYTSIQPFSHTSTPSHWCTGYTRRVVDIVFVVSTASRYRAIE